MNFGALLPTAIGHQDNEQYDYDLGVRKLTLAADN
jgi:hypothetical protein